MHLHLNVLTRFAHALPINCKTYWTNSSLSEFKWLCEKSARCKNVCVFFHHLKLPPRSRVNHSSWLRDYISSFFLQPSEPHGSIGREQKVGKWVHCSAGGIGDFPAKAENYPIPINPSNQKFPMAIFKTIGRNLGWEKRERGDTVAFFCKWKFPTERHNFSFSEKGKRWRFFKHAFYNGQRKNVYNSQSRWGKCPYFLSEPPKLSRLELLPGNPVTLQQKPAPLKPSILAQTFNSLLIWPGQVWQLSSISAKVGFLSLS